MVLEIKIAVYVWANIRRKRSVHGLWNVKM